MFKYKKFAAMLLSLTLAASAVAVPGIYAAADNEDTISAAEVQEDTAEDNGYTVSGPYSYSLTADGNIRLEEWSVSDETELTVPDQIDGIAVTEIGSKAFGQNSVEKIIIPAGIEYISADNPFTQSEKLKEILVDAANANYCSEDGVLYSKDKTQLLCWPMAKSGSSFTVPAGVTELGIAAFYDSELTEVKLPDGLELMGRHCFAFSKLESIDMSNTALEYIDTMAFVECSALSDVTFSESTNEIDGGAFAYCISLTDVMLPSALEYVGQYAFIGTGLTRVRIPSTVQEISYSAFGYDRNEDPVSGFVIIGDYNSAAYRYATDSDPEYDYYNDFDFISVETADYEDEYAALEKYTSGDFEYTLIDGEACVLRYNSAAEIINVPAELDGYKVTSIYTAAFLTSDADGVIIPETVKSIGGAAFPQYSISVTIPSDCTFDDEEPFISYSLLEEINVVGEGGQYSSKDGVLYSSGGTVLFAYPAAKADESFTVPDNVREIGMSAFLENTYLQSIDLNMVEDINLYAFESCTSLSSVKSTKGLKNVAAYAFYNCPQLKSIRLYDDLETIDVYAFGFTDGQDEPVLVDGYKIYTDKGTLGYQYAKDNGIEIVSGTILLGSKNVDKGFLYVIAGIICAAVIALICFLTGKSIKKKKAEKKKTGHSDNSGKLKTGSDNNSADAPEEKEDADEK